MAGQCKKGIGVDCVRYVAACADELFNSERRAAIPRIAQDAAWHNPKHVMRAARIMMTAYAPYIEITNNEVEPGDIIAVGPGGGGPAHIMMVGGVRLHIWHAISKCVSQGGTIIWAPFEVKRIYRPMEKHKWAACPS